MMTRRLMKVKAGFGLLRQATKDAGNRRILKEADALGNLDDDK